MSNTSATHPCLTDVNHKLRHELKSYLYFDTRMIQEREKLAAAEAYDERDEKVEAGIKAQHAYLLSEQEHAMKLACHVYKLTAGEFLALLEEYELQCKPKSSHDRIL